MAAPKSIYKPIRELNDKEKFIKICIPLTKTSGKIRVKSRNRFNDYGLPVPTRKEKLTEKCYIEWQISYDVPVKDDKNFTTLKTKDFIGSNGKKKYLFELSECIKYFYDWGVVSKEELLEIKTFLSSITKDKYLDVDKNLLINRTHPIETTINGFDFLYSRVEYPLLVYSFKNYEVLTEIQIKEKQRAVGTQPMLYLCFNITELDDSEKLLNRTVDAKEEATFTFNENNKDVLLQMLKFFGTLSNRHKYDVIKIIDLILNWS